MSNFKLNKSNSNGNIGTKFLGNGLMKFDGSLCDKLILLKLVKNYVRILVGAHVPVRYSTNDDTSYTDGKSITISSVVLEESLDSTIGLGLHEASHVVLTDFGILKDLMDKKLLDKKYNKGLYIIKNLFNWIEDRRIDYWAINKSPGFEKYYIELYNRYFYTDKVTNILKRNSFFSVDETVENYLFYIINSLHPDVHMNELKGLEEINKIIDIGNISRWTTTGETLDVGVKIYDVIMKHVRKNAGVVPSDEQTELSDKITDALTTQKAYLDGDLIDDFNDKIKIDLDGDISKLIEILETTDSSIETINKSDNDKVKNQTIDVLTIRKIDLDGVKSNLYSIFAKDPILKNKPFIDRGFSLGVMLGKKLKVRDDIKNIKTIKLPKGKLDKRNVHNAGWGSKNIFFNVKENNYEDIAIHISVDVSGSMEGKKWENTLVAIIAICKACSTVRGIRVQLSFRFADKAYGKISTVKWNEQAVVMNFYDSDFDSINKLKYLIHLKPVGGTPEGVCFEALKRDIMKPLLNKNTLFINFSDGRPGMINLLPSDGIRITKNVIKEFKKTKMTILSYFISSSPNVRDESFIEMYGSDAEFVDVKTLINLAKTINLKLLKMG